MDVSNILAAQVAKFQGVTVEKETPLDIDAGLLLVTDLNTIDEESYNENLEDHLQSLARDGVQTLLTALFTLPTKPSPDGPLALLPPPTTKLPRAKPLPKPKPPTKWEKFAAAKGISHVKKDKKVWDEEKQDWVDRWGRHGKNKEAQEQWIHEVPMNADADWDPRKAARDERKERVAKNEKKQQQNLARASNPRQQRKEEIEGTLASTRISTASMGKFDKKLDGEKKIRGVKRKFEPTEISIAQENQTSLNLLNKMDSDSKKMRKEPRDESEGTLNVRKAISHASKGRGGIALGRELSASGRGGGRGRGGRGRGGRGRGGRS